MQKSIRSTALVFAALAIPAVSYAREPMGTNPRPQVSMSSAGEPLGTNPRPQVTSANLLNQIVLAVSVVSGR